MEGPEHVDLLQEVHGQGLGAQELHGRGLGLGNGIGKICSVKVLTMTCLGSYKYKFGIIFRYNKPRPLTCSSFSTASEGFMSGIHAGSSPAVPISP